MRSQHALTLGVVTLTLGGLLLAPASARTVSQPDAARPAGEAPVAKAGAAAKPPRTVIAVTFEADSSLVRIHPRTGRSTIVGASGVTLTDVTARGAKLYAIGFGSLYTLSRSTGLATFVGNLGAADANALATRPKNRALYAAGTAGELYKVNRHTGVAATVGTFGHSLGSMGDLAFIGKHLYAAVLRSTGTKTLLARINVRTGKATVIGSTGFSAVFGLIAAKRHLYGATSTGIIISISKKTGRGHRLSNTALPIGGLTS